MLFIHGPQQEICVIQRHSSMIAQKPPPPTKGSLVLHETKKRKQRDVRKPLQSTKLETHTSTIPIAWITVRCFLIPPGESRVRDNYGWWFTRIQHLIRRLALVGWRYGMRRGKCWWCFIQTHRRGKRPDHVSGTGTTTYLDGLRSSIVSGRPRARSHLNKSQSTASERCCCRRCRPRHMRALSSQVGDGISERVDAMSLFDKHQLVFKECLL